MSVVRPALAGFSGLLLAALLGGALAPAAALPAASVAQSADQRGGTGSRTYRLTDLGVLDGEDSRAYAVGSSGYVAGLGDTYPGSGSRSFHAFRWTPRHPFAVTGELADLGTLAGDDRSGAFGVNRSGLTVGVSLSSEGGSAAFVFDGRMRRLPGLRPSGAGLSGAEDVDDRGRIVGYARAKGGADHAVLWVPRGSGFRVVDLGVPPGRVGSSAAALSARGHVVGSVSDPDYYGFAALWTPKRPHGTSGAWQELGVLPGGTGSAARDVNRLGVVVGEGDSAEGDRGWMVDTRVDTVMQLLPTLPGGWASHAFAVNDHGLVVGYSDLGDGTGDRAVVWRDGVVTDLNGWLPAWARKAGYILRGAYDVNNRGQIVGVAGVPTPTGEHAHGFLLTP